VSGGRRGFTLIELSVSLVVAGLVVLGAHQAVVITTEARARVAQAGEDKVRSAGARDLLSLWLRGAVLRPDASPFQETAEPGWDSESVVFRVEHGGALFPGRRLVRLWIERGAGQHRGLMAAVSRGPGEAGPVHTILLEPMAERLSLRYWGAVDGTEHWVDEWDDPDALPDVVELRLGTTPRVRVGPGVAASWDLPPLLRLPVRTPVAMAGS
jgi:prepilin-type N-terminal cleavage/methylation domain-containing protein